MYENYVSLCIIFILFSFFLATYCYVVSFILLIFKKNGNGKREKILVLGGNLGNIIYDWFIGRELNFRFGLLDIKMFLELRFGMLLWLLINFFCLYYYYLKIGKINDVLVLVNFL